MNEPLYHFRFRGKLFGPGTLSQLTANPLLVQVDAGQIEVRSQVGGDWMPLGQVVDFTRPWRSLRMGHRHVRLPRFQRTTWEQLVDMFHLRGSTVSAEKDALEIPDTSIDCYKCRWADTQEEFATTEYNHMLACPPFPAEIAWKVELKRNGSRIWVPLPSLVNLSKGWPTPKRRPALEQARRQALQAQASPPPSFAQCFADPSNARPVLIALSVPMWGELPMLSLILVILILVAPSDWFRW